MKLLRATAEANPNIAIVKYWGKRDENLILPKAGSVSATLDDSLKTRTTAMFSESFREDEVWINGKKMQTPEEMGKALSQLNAVRAMAKTNLRAKVVSVANTPVAGGLAGSAAGLCALAAASAEALGLKPDAKGLSILARRGSGSACRSVFGGFAEWISGEKADGSDSYAVQVADESHWPEFRAVVGIAESGEKKVKSRAGMKQTVATSELYKKRLEAVPSTIRECKKAILEKNAEKLFTIAMRESNNMHATMLDTWPPIIYMNDASREVIYAVHEFNKDGIKAGYSFDAGPNPVIFTLDKYVPAAEKILKGAGIKKVFVSKAGKGPKILSSEKDHLIDEKGKAK